MKLVSFGGATDMHLSYADILARRVPLRSADAAALVLAACHAVRDRYACEPGGGCPSPSAILLSGSGRVMLDAWCPREDEADVRRLAALLHELLVRAQLGGGAPAAVPGALLLLVARAVGAIDLPVPTLAEFTATVSRFGFADPVTLGRLYRRCVTLNPAGAAAQPMPVPEFGGTALAVASIPEAASSAAADARAAGEPGVDRRRADAARLNPPSRWQRAVANLAAAAMTAAVLVGAAGLLLQWRPERTSTPTIGRSDHPGPTTAQAAEDAAAASAAPPVESPVRSPALRPPGSADAAAAVAATAPAVTAARPLLSARDVGADVFSPSFVDDGRGVLFHTGRTRGALMRASFNDRGEATVVPVIRDDAANFHASLSPDGRSLAFDSDRHGSRGVYVARASGEGAERVSGDGYAVAPRWSPDGRTLAFVRAEPARPRVWNVWTVDVQTRTLSRISRHSVGQAWAPSWFPGGRRLAYSVEDTLVIVDLSSGRSRVHRSPVRGRLVRTPAVSPDGRRIVFQVFRDGVWMLDLGSGRLQRILDDVTAEEFAWGPAGNAVAYHAKTGGVWSIWQLPLAAGTG